MLIEIHFPETFHAIDGFYPKSTPLNPTRQSRASEDRYGRASPE